MVTIKYAHAFVYGAGAETKTYLFMRNLGRGTQGAAQRVIDPDTKQVFVRKATIGLPRGDKKNREVIMAETIAKAVSLTRPVAANRPLVPLLIQATDHIDSFVGESRKDKATDTLWTYCNGYDLDDFIEKFEFDNTVIPNVVIWRFLSNMLQNLDFLQHMKPYVIVHHDLGPGNIFLHWPNDTTELPDFYIGDFGYADFWWNMEMGTHLTRQFDIPELVGTHRGIFNDLMHTVRLAEKLIRSSTDEGEAPPTHSRYEHRPQALFTILTQIAKVAAKSYHAGGSPPDLTVLRRTIDIEAALAANKGFPKFRYFTEPNFSNVPQLYDSKEQCLASRNVLGPWHLATVDADTLKVLEVEERTHTRPNEGNASSNEDSGERPIDPAKAEGAMTASQWQRTKLTGGVADAADPVLGGPKSDSDKSSTDELFFGPARVNSATLAAPAPPPPPSIIISPFPLSFDSHHFIDDADTAIEGAPIGSEPNIPNEDQMNSDEAAAFEAFLAGM